MPDGLEGRKTPVEDGRIEVHNVWTVYGLHPDGTEVEQPFAEMSRPQDWGHPRWVYHRFTFEWLTCPDAKTYRSHVHAWTDLTREPHEYPQLFASLLVNIYMPGATAELCGRDYLDEWDFWDDAWGPMPPVWSPPDGRDDGEDIWDDDAEG